MTDDRPPTAIRGQRLRRGLVALSLVSLLAACSGPDIRPKPRPLAPGIPELPVTMAWSHAFPVSSDAVSAIGAEGVPAFTIAPKGLVYVAEDDRVVQLDVRAGGHERWQVALSDGTTRFRVADGLAADASVLVMASLDGQVAALDAVDGHEIWRRPLPGEVLAPPALDAQRVFVHTGNGQLVALDRATGKRLWVYSEVLPSLTLRGTSAPIVAGDKVIAGFANGRLVALDAATGSLLWTNEVGVPEGRTVLARMVDIDADPVVIDGLVHASAYQRRLLAASVVSGRTVWSRDISTHLDMAHDAKQLYLVGEKGQVWAIDHRTGEIIWRQDALEYRQLSCPVVVDRRVLLADAAGYLHALSVEDGAIGGRYRYDSEQDRAPVLRADGSGLLLREPSGRMIRLIWETTPGE